MWASVSVRLSDQEGIHRWCARSCVCANTHTHTFRAKADISEDTSFILTYYTVTTSGHTEGGDLDCSQNSEMTPVWKRMSLPLPFGAFCFEKREQLKFLENFGSCLLRVDAEWELGKTKNGKQGVFQKPEP